MALTGIEIFKKLPKTNCGECGVPTCLAFAMKLAAGQAELSACPYVSADAKSKLEDASAPPIRPVTIGTGADALKIGKLDIAKQLGGLPESKLHCSVLAHDGLAAAVQDYEKRKKN